MKKGKPKRFKALEDNQGDAPIKDKKIEWEGQELGVESDTKLETDTGTGQSVVLRFFDFGANYEIFKQHKPTAQELFDSHMNGMLSLLWGDGLKPFEGVQPRLMFSKDKLHYRFIIACVPTLGGSFSDSPRTLTQLIRK